MVNLKDNTAGLGFNAGSFGKTNEVKDYATKTKVSKKSKLPDTSTESKVSSLVSKIPDLGPKLGLPIHTNTSDIQKKMTSVLVKGLKPNGLLGEIKSGLTRSANGDKPCKDFDSKAASSGWSLGLGLHNFHFDSSIFLGPISAITNGLKDGFNYIAKSAFELSQMSEEAIIEYYKYLERMKLDKLFHDNKSAKTVGDGLSSYLKDKDKVTECDVADLNNNKDVVKEASKSNKSLSNSVLKSVDTSKIKDKKTMYKSITDFASKTAGSNKDVAKMLNLKKHKKYKELGKAVLKYAQPSITKISEPSIEAMAF